MNRPPNKAEEYSSALNRREFAKRFGLTLSAACALPYGVFAHTPAKSRRPNIVLILSDDVGYGDLSCYGASVVRTPNVDKLAARGLRFTDAHSDAATCTPSRYSILTGAYAWRKQGASILPGDAALLIDPRKPTLPSALKQAGYVTGCVGKWHLGLGDGNIDWNGEIRPGPYELGFDYSFILPATADRVPCVYVENGRVVGLDPRDPIVVSYKENIGTDPIGAEHPEMLRMQSEGAEHAGTIVDGVSRIGFMSGGHSARWVDELIAPTLLKRATKFIEENKDHPFFLYFATSDIHVPRVPNDKFVNTSACGLRCDAIRQLDWTTGQIMETLEKLNLTEDTLVIFTSDNGPIVDDGYADGSAEHLNGHKPSGNFRGGKYEIYEGGTRIPLITYWPQHIQPGVSDPLVGQVDFLASFAALAGAAAAPRDAGPDSVNLLPALLGQSKQGREILVEEADRIAIRKGQWKLVDNSFRLGRPSEKRTMYEAKYELYDLAKDSRESRNIADEHPEIVRELAAQLEKIRSQTV